MSEIFSIEQDKPGSFNSVGWRNEKADQLLKAAASTTDKNTRKAIYSEWQKIINDEFLT